MASVHASRDELQHVLGIVEFPRHGFVVARGQDLHVGQFPVEQGPFRRSFADLREILRLHLVLLHLHDEIACHL